MISRKTGSGRSHSGSTKSSRAIAAAQSSGEIATDEIMLIPNEPVMDIKMTVCDIVRNKAWKTLDLRNVLSLRDADYLSPVEYTEICTAWIEYHRPDQSSVERIWDTVPFHSLCDRYIWDLKNHLTDYLKYQVHAKASKNRHIITYSFTCNPTELKNKKETWAEWQGCGIADCAHLRNHAVKLQLKHDSVPLYTRDKKVKYPPCNKISLRHYHPGAVVHWWGWTDTWRYRQLPNNSDTLEFDSLDDEHCQRTFVSMLTNTLDEFIVKINQGGWKYIACMVKLK